VYDKILVGYDGHDGGADALALGERLAAATGAPMLVAASYPRVSYHATIVAAGDLEEQMRAETEERLRAAVEHVSVPGGVEERIVAGSSPAAALHRLAVREGADLVVLGSARHGAVGRLLIGDTGNRLLHAAPFAVAVAPTGYRERPAPHLGSIGVGYDATPESEIALMAATTLASATGARLRLLSVVEPATATWTFAPTAWQRAFSVDDLLDELVTERRGEIDRALAGIDPAIAADGAVLTGSPADKLAEVAGRELDLLLVGSRAYGPLRRVLLGGVSFELMRSAGCPLLVVPRGAAEAGREAPAEAEVSTREAPRPG
jgi:nucleotide-binding universal stress UspA family protein